MYLCIHVSISIYLYIYPYLSLSISISLSLYIYIYILSLSLSLSGRLHAVLRRRGDADQQHPGWQVLLIIIIIAIIIIAIIIIIISSSSSLICSQIPPLKGGCILRISSSLLFSLLVTSQFERRAPCVALVGEHLGWQVHPQENISKETWTT